MVAVEEVTAQLAGEALRRAGVSDPRGVNTPEAIAAGGSCMRVRTERGDCVIVARIEAGTFWMDGAASDRSAGLAPLLGELAEAAARRAGCTRTAFETERPGLVRVARRQGWRIRAFVLEKDV